MKKLKLNLGEINQAEVLTREQLKKIYGGFGSTTSVLCYCAAPLTESGAYAIQWISADCPTGEAAVISKCGSASAG